MATNRRYSWLSRNPSNRTTLGAHLSAAVLLAGLAACTPVSHPYSVESTLQQLGPAKPMAESRLANMSTPDLLAAGQEYLNAKNSQLARLHYAMVLQHEPTNPTAFVGIGQALYLQGEGNQARESFSQALKTDPSNSAALLGIARIYREQAFHSTAIEYLERILADSPDQVEALSELAMNQDALGNESVAAELHRRVVALRPEDPSAFNNLGFNALLQGHYPEAVEAFRQALALRPDDKQVRNNLATVHALNGDEELALQQFEVAVGKPAAYNNLGYIYMTQGEWDKAERAYKKALDLSPVFYLRAQENLERLNRMRTKTDE